MTELSETAHELTHTHKRRTTTEDGDVWGDEPALLDILAGCVASDSGRGSASGVARTGSPVDLGALDLWAEITRIIDTCWPGNGDPAYVRVPATIKLNAWVVHTTDPVAEGALLDLCRQWVARIRETIEPTRRMPLAGVECPVCGWDRFPVEQDGEWVYRPTLVAYPEAQPVRVECTYPDCPTTEDNPNTWAGRDVTDTFLKHVTVESVVM